MGQMSFAKQFNALPFSDFNPDGNVLNISPFLIEDNISLNTVNVIFRAGINAVHSESITLGLYSITGSTLSLANSCSGQRTNSAASFFIQYVSMTNTSSTQNITPGTWFWGIIGIGSSTGGGGGTRPINILAGTISAGNSFPGSFIGGKMTETTNALPSSIAISDLDTASNESLYVPFILVSA